MYRDKYLKELAQATPLRNLRDRVYGLPPLRFSVSLSNFVRSSSPSSLECSSSPARETRACRFCPCPCVCVCVHRTFRSYAVRFATRLSAKLNIPPAPIEQSRNGRLSRNRNSLRREKRVSVSGPRALWHSDSRRIIDVIPPYLKADAKHVNDILIIASNNSYFVLL